MIPQEIIDRIIQSTDIVDTISEYVRLKKIGANYQCVCPFHDDGKASLAVSPAKRMWKCFGCGEGGNVLSFVQKHEAVSFPEAVKIVAKRCGITVPEKEFSDEEREAFKRRETLYIALQAAQEQFTSRKNDPAAQRYLTSRGFSAEILEAYGAGYAPKNFTLLADTLTQRGYSVKTLTDVGLLNQKEAKTYDRFINRVTFPFHDLSGNIVGFTGRSIDNDDKSPKYLNSPETELFSKGKTLFGIYQAKQSIQQFDKAYIVEGQFDVLSLVAAGYTNTVCGSGTAFTSDQARLLRKFTDNVTLLYDGDAAGAKAAVRNIDILLSHGLKVRAALLPSGHDPDSFIKKSGKEAFEKWIKRNEVDFITFLWQLHKEELNDPIRQTEVVQSIAASIAAVPSELQQNNYIAHLSKRFKVDAALLLNEVEKAIPPIIKTEKGVTAEPGVYGLEDAEDLLGQNKRELTITYDPQEFAKDWGTNPTIFIVGEPTSEDIQLIRSVSYVINCRDHIEIDSDMTEPEVLELLKRLHTSGFTVTVTVTEKSRKAEENEEPKTTIYSFTEFYVMAYAKFKGGSEWQQNTAIERCAELLSYADSITLNVRLKDYAQLLGITKMALEKVVKPFLEKRKSEERFKNDTLDDDDVIPFSSSRLPDYVQESDELMKMYNQFGFFPMLDKNERKIAYVFRSKGTFIRVGNFYIEPLLHIYDKNSEDNKRVVELTQRRMPYPIYMEWVSKEMITMQSFRQRLWEEGDINFSNGSQQYLDTINESWEGKFKRCTELRMYGYYDDGFFAFSNAIYHQVENKWQLQEVSDLGLVEHNGLNYYIPVYSKIYRNERRDNDKYFLDRFIRYREPKNPISFEQWANLMNEVYKENENGKWAIIYAFMCAFRSDIFEVDRIFTALFFIGPTGSGKSELAYSIRSLFMPPEAPIFNLNQGTDAAMFTLLEKYRNIPVILDEYNDNQISDVKFQGLKAAVYDGEGKQKRKDASTKELDTSEINAPLILCGQESPQRDDNSLANRSIVRIVPKNDARTEREDEVFRELKMLEKAGLQNILLQVLQYKKTIREHYTRVQREVYKELKDSIRENVINSDGLSRILNTYSMFLAMCRVIESYTDFKLPFTFQEFRKIAEKELLKQVESISSSNKLFSFFAIIDMLIDNHLVVEGRDFKIEAPGKLTLKKQGRETYEVALDPADTRVIHLRLENIYPHYSRFVGNRDVLSRASLRSYLESHESWIGAVKSTRFTWKEAIETTSGGFTMKDIDQPVPDNTVKRVMKDRTMSTSSIVLNYDILQELLSVDYQRDYEEEELAQEPEEEMF